MSGGILNSHSAMSEPVTTVEPTVVEQKRPSNSTTGAFFGAVAFLAGLGLLFYTFKLAYDQFNIPPETSLHIPPGKALDTTIAVQSFAGLIIRVLLLIVMAIVGAMITNRGIKMYTDSRS